MKAYLAANLVGAHGALCQKARKISWGSAQPGRPWPVSSGWKGLRKGPGGPRKEEKPPGSGPLLEEESVAVEAV